MTKMSLLVALRQCIAPDERPECGGNGASKYKVVSVTNIK